MIDDDFTNEDTDPDHPAFGSPAEVQFSVPQSLRRASIAQYVSIMKSMQVIIDLSDPSDRHDWAVYWARMYIAAIRRLIRALPSPTRSVP